MQLAASALDPGAQGHALSAWIRQAVEHLVIDQNRRHVDASKRSLSSEVEDGEQLARARSTTPSPTRFARQRERVEALWVALTSLSQSYREVLVHRFLEGRSVPETAALLGKSEGAISTQQHRALSRLRQAYAGPEPTGY